MHRLLAVIPAWFILLLALSFIAAACEENDCKDCDKENEADDDDDNDSADDDAIDPQDCAACHADVAAAWENFSTHQVLYTCDFCHMEIDVQPGAGHRDVAWCDSCHSEKTHVPTYYDADDTFRLISCTTCHEPHGSTNLYLIRNQVLVAEDELVTIVFQNILGLADDSYAQPGDRSGAGLCEVCHATTKYYNQSGTGLPHNTTKCTDCHQHSTGFLN